MNNYLGLGKRNVPKYMDDLKNINLRGKYEKKSFQTTLTYI